MAGLADILLGQDPDKVELPRELTEGSEGRAAALKRIRDMMADPSKSAAVQTVQAQGRRGAEDIARRQASAQAGVRGPGSLLAARNLGAQAGEQQQSLAGDVAQSVGQLTASEQARGQEQELRILSEQEAAAIRRKQLQRAMAGPGVLDAIGTVAGGLAGGGIGALFDKAGKTEREEQGASLGTGLGQALGQAFERR